MTKALLQVRDLRTHFETRAGTIKAVDGISFTLEDLQIFLDKRKPGQSRFVTQRRRQGSRRSCDS